MEVIRSFEMSVFTKDAERHITEDGIFHSHRRETSILTVGGTASKRPILALTP
jgi:hypothetical protein